MQRRATLHFGNSILNSLVTLFADTFGLPSSTGSTMIFPATAWLEIGSVFIQTEGRMPGAKNPHRFLECLSFRWSFPIPALTKPGCFPYKISQDLGLRWEDCWEMLLPALRHLTRSGTWCAKPKNAFSSVGR